MNIVGRIRCKAEGFGKSSKGNGTTSSGDNTEYQISCPFSMFGTDPFIFCHWKITIIYIIQKIDNNLLQ